MDININFNAFPFRLRFSTENKQYHEISNVAEELSSVLLKLNIEMRDKTEIRNILRYNFASIGGILKKIFNYLDAQAPHGENNEPKYSELRKLVEEKLARYCEDEQESSCFTKVKETIVEVGTIPANWKCLTWQKYAPLPKIGVDHSTIDPNVKLKQPISSDAKTDLKELFEKDIEDIYNTFGLVNNRIQLMKNRIIVLNENIIWLFLNFKEYLKVLVKFDKQFPDEDTSTDTDLQSIKRDIDKIFDIELKIDFFSNSITAYKLKTNEQFIRLELKRFESILEPPLSQNHLGTASVCNTIQDGKNLVVPLNYLTEMYIDPNNMHYTSNPTAH